MSVVAETGPDFAAYAEVTETGHLSETFLVEGVHCAACIQKVESALQAQPFVSYARLNFSTKRLRVEWDGPLDRVHDIVGAIRAQGYGVQPYDPKAVQAESDEEERFLQLSLGVAAFAAGNIMMISVGLWASTIEAMGVGTRDLLHWISALIAIPAVAYAGRPFFRSAWSVLKHGKTNMDVPISIGVIGAVLVSIWQTLHSGEDAYFDSAVMLLFFLLIGRYLDFRARRRARGAASDLLAMMSGTAVVLSEDGSQKSVPIRDLKEGMKVLVPMGLRIPADSRVLSGESEIDTSLVTGETLPRGVKEGDTVFAGTINLSAPLTLMVTSAAKDSLLSDIVRLMEKAEQGQAKYVRLADRAARLYTPFVHTLAALTFFGWWLGVGIDGAHAVLIAVTVLIITCPCALGLAVPVVQVLATGRLMKRQILVKAGDAFERLAGIDTVLLDKTGTLTLGKPALVNGDEISTQQFQLAASLAVHSHHPLSKALAASWAGDVLSVFDVKELPGKGIEATWSGKIVRLGSAAWCGNPSQSHHDMQEIWLQVDDTALACFMFRDQLRVDTKETIGKLKELGLKPVLLSGDRVEVAESVARELGIDDVAGGLSPVGKYQRMEALKAAGHKVLMVGDGLNDAPTIAGADVSISPSSAIDMAQNAADIVFMGDKLGAIVEVYRTSVFAQKLVKENFALAILYNIIAVPLAVAGLVTPLIAAIAMSGSSLVVIANSFRLSRMKG
ncbi:MAG TPA: heavy metal translocating P-type ATPase [Alphaproteobacteria bacterium]|nr:heavy metal translocating P-type ATPase [Alphaproteobacteria bacterium]HNS43719.1 heavy metal translocating P-type ATPase [Alphaproteobacteria bacterium]